MLEHFVHLVYLQFDIEVVVVGICIYSKLVKKKFFYSGKNDKKSSSEMMSIVSEIGGVKSEYKKVKK